MSLDRVPVPVCWAAGLLVGTVWRWHRGRHCLDELDWWRAGWSARDELCQSCPTRRESV